MNEGVFRKDQKYARTVTENESKVQTVKEPWIPSYRLCTCRTIFPKTIRKMANSREWMVAKYED